MVVYLDTSAVVKRYVMEAGSEAVRALVREAQATVTALVTRAEVVAALARARRMGRLTAEEADRARQTFEAEWDDFVRVQMTEQLAAQAASFAWTYGLRGYDAVHLASAVFWQTQSPFAILLATYDRELWEAARRVGLTCWPEEAP